MSVKLMTAVFESNLETTEKFVLLCLADHASDDGKNAFPSVQLICKKTSLSERSVRGALARLRDTGHIVIQRYATQHFPTCYQLTLGRPAESAPLNFRGASGAVRGASGAKTETQGCSTCIPEVQQVHPNHQEPSEEKENHHEPARAREYATPNFLRVYEAYPNKIDKREAIREWFHVPFAEKEVETILAGVFLWKSSEQWREERYIPSLAKFLKNRRWEVRPPQEKGKIDERSLEAARAKRR